MNNYFVKSDNCHQLEDIYKLISREEFDLILSTINAPNKDHYFNAICCCVDEMHDIRCLERVVRRYIQEIKEYPEQFSRSFIHLMVGYKLKRYGQLKEIETAGAVSYDFILNNGLKIELTRVRDFEQVAKKRILKEIKKIPLLNELSLLFYIKTLEIDSVIKKMRGELKKPPFKEYIENEVFDLIIQPKSNSLSMPVNTQIGGILHLSTGPKNNLGIQFKAKSVKLIDLILEKNKHEACRNSDVIIVDLTDDLSIIGKNTLEEELKLIDAGLIPENLKIIIFTSFYWSENIIKAELKYRIFHNNAIVEDFEKNFLQKDGLYEKIVESDL
jgi:hypothetical protein